jgi:hypothetical protein
MRIFLIILSLLAAGACLFLDVLGYNGTLSWLQFILITAAVELLLCLLLGHFMHRTYANRKRAKAQAQELTNAQAALQLAQQEARSAREAAAAATAARDDALAQAASARQTAPAPASQQYEPQATQPLPTANTDQADPLGTTTLYRSPLA